LAEPAQADGENLENRTEPKCCWIFI